MKIIYVILGYISLALGFLGIIIPGIPTTPFLLFTAILFSKGSDRFYNWFINTKFYIKYAKDFAESKSMTLKNKIVILSVASVMLLAAFFMVNYWHAKLAIILVFIFKYYYFIFKIKTIPNTKGGD